MTRFFEKILKNRSVLRCTTVMQALHERYGRRKTRVVVKPPLVFLARSSKTILPAAVAPPSAGHGYIHRDIPEFYFFFLFFFSRTIAYTGPAKTRHQWMCGHVDVKHLFFYRIFISYLISQSLALDLRGWSIDCIQNIRFCIQSKKIQLWLINNSQLNFRHSMVDLIWDVCQLT